MKVKRLSCQQSTSSLSLFVTFFVVALACSGDRNVSAFVAPPPISSSWGRSSFQSFCKPDVCRSDNDHLSQGAIIKKVLNTVSRVMLIKDRRRILVLNSNIGNNQDDKRSSSACVVERLSLTQQFERWKFLQDLLDGDINSLDANQLLYQVLMAYKSTPNKVLKQRSYPLLDENDKATIQALLDESNSDTLEIEIFQGDQCEASSNKRTLDFITELETLLPDPDEEEDAHKGNWDTIIELHGRESVKINQRINNRDWEARCTVARVLLWFEFLAEGVLDSP